MRRILWLSSLALLVFLFAAAIVYLANPLSMRTWILGKALRSPVSSMRSAAERKLAAGDPEEAAEVFVDAHARSSNELYNESYRRFGLLPPETTGRLAEMLDDPDPSWAKAAADGLAVLYQRYKGHDFSAVLPALVRAVERGNAALGWSAAAAGISIDPRNPELMKAILRAARNGNPPILGFLETAELTETGVNQLLDCLAGEDLELRRTVTLLLGSLEAHEERVVPPLVTLLEDANPLLVMNALYSLEQLEHKDSVTVRKAIDLLRHDDVRSTAVGFLLRSTAFPEALAAIKAALRESSRAGGFLEVLRNESPGSLSPELTPELLDLCRGPDRELRLAAMNVLAHMGPAAKSAVPAIEEIIAQNQDPDFEEATRLALEDIKNPEPAPTDG